MTRKIDGGWLPLIPELEHAWPDGTAIAFEILEDGTVILTKADNDEETPPRTRTRGKPDRS